jgi:hypothetical protein
MMDKKKWKEGVRKPDRNGIQEGMVEYPAQVYSVYPVWSRPTFSAF